MSPLWVCPCMNALTCAGSWKSALCTLCSSHWCMLLFAVNQFYKQWATENLPSVYNIPSPFSASNSDMGLSFIAYLGHHLRQKKLSELLKILHSTGMNARRLQELYLLK